MHMLLLEKPWLYLIKCPATSPLLSGTEGSSLSAAGPTRLKMKSSLSRLHAPHFCTSVLSKQPAGLQEAPSQP